MAMNLFRLCGDTSHSVGVAILLWKLLVHQNAQGVSVRSQELFLLVFVTRYLDLFTSFFSWYNTLLKVFYIVSAATIIYIVRLHNGPTKRTFKQGHDTARHWECAVVPSMILAILITFGPYLDIMESLWTFSIILEVFAIIPQAIVSLRYSEAENFARNFMFFMGAYRALYIINWIYRAHTERGYPHSFVSYTCGVAETAVYIVFFYIFFKRKSQAEASEPIGLIRCVESPDSYCYERACRDDADDEDDVETEDDVYEALTANGEAAVVLEEAAAEELDPAPVVSGSTLDSNATTAIASTLEIV